MSVNNGLVKSNAGSFPLVAFNCRKKNCLFLQFKKGFHLLQIEQQRVL